MYPGVCMRVRGQVEAVGSLYHAGSAGSGDRLQVTRLGGKYPYLLSHLTGPIDISNLKR